jgi:integrase
MGKLTAGVSIPGVFEKDGRYYKVVQGKWHKLSRVDEGRTALYRALTDFETPRPVRMSELFILYQATGMDHLKPATKADYENILLRLDKTWGHIEIGKIKPNQVAHWLETRRRIGKGGIRVNREMAVLSAVFNFGMRHMHCEFNPCRGVHRNTERPKKRYVTNEQFLEVFERANEAFQDLLAVAYLTGCRQTDIISWTRSGNLRPEGICYTQSKTGKPHTIEWSDALRHFVRRAMERFPDCDLVLNNTLGYGWGVWAVTSQLKRLKAGWAFKDLRAKAQTDSAHSVLGHGAALEATYRKVLRTKPVR